MAEEERKDAMMALGRIVLAIEGLKMDYKQDVQTIIYALQSATECKNMNDILLAMSESHAGSLNDAKEAIAAIYAAGMMIVSQDPHTKLERVDLDQFLLKSVNHYCDGNNRAISLIKAKYGELYAEVKE